MVAAAGFSYLIARDKFTIAYLNMPIHGTKFRSFVKRVLL
jgi:hypothetical protein